MLEANLGLRISDIVQLRLCDIVKDGNRYRLAIIEQKTGKARVFTVPLALYQFTDATVWIMALGAMISYSRSRNGRYRSI